MYPLTSENFRIGVVHCKKVNDYFPAHRPFPLGNPFPMEDEKDRDRVCDEYEKYFQERLLAQDPVILNELCRAIRMTIERGYINLGCYCAPRRCHTWTIKNYLEKVLNPDSGPSEVSE